jgi:hypothetical protein
VGNGYRDTTRNTAQGARDVETCAAIIGDRCYVSFASGQMEQVLDDLVCVSYIEDGGGVDRTVRALRAAGIAGAIRVCVEHVEGCPITLYTA